MSTEESGPLTFTELTLQPQYSWVMVSEVSLLMRATTSTVSSAVNIDLKSPPSARACTLMVAGLASQSWLDREQP